jgi:Peptidase A4 family
MLKRNSIMMALVILALFALAACSTPAVNAARNSQPDATAVPATSAPLPAASPTTPAANASAPGTASPSSAQVKAIQSVIQKANQEQVQAVAAQSPTVMQDSATTSYYQQSVQTLNDLLNSGVTAIQLVSLKWGPIVLQGATTAQATTSETWSTSLSDGSTMKETDTNVYILLLQNGAWKVQDDQHPNTGPARPPSTNPGGSPAPVAPAAPPPAGSAQAPSRNWSGYAATGGAFTAVSGTWTVPNVSAGTTGMDATWVGIGGVTAHDLIQAGTQAMVQAGQVVYSAWWETLPQMSQTVPLNINAGDKVSVSITQQSDGMWRILIRDATNSQSWQKSVAYRSSLSSADWIEEAPSTGRRTLLPLDAFGVVTFTAGTTVENGQTRTVAQASGQPITMNSGAGQALAQTSALAVNGDAFTVTRTSTPAPTFSRGGRPFSGTAKLP